MTINFPNPPTSDRIEHMEEYQLSRLNEYPSHGAQLDMIYWDQVNGTTTFKDFIQAIKDRHPKP